MNQVATLSRPRTLAHVLLDLAEQRRLNDACYRRWDRAHKEQDRAEEDRQGDIGAAIDARISDLEAEAKVMIEAATGVAWGQIYEALS
jgi:hypothetical protein